MNNIAEGMKNYVENEYSRIEKEEGWACFFNGIRNECAQNHSYTSLEARKNENKSLNRYRDVNPYDHSRVILSKGSCDYINANLVVVEKARRKYILTQGPLPQTTSHFWLMIWEQNSKAIIMLNRVIEKNMIKCHQYWPTANDDSFVFNDVSLKVTNISEVKASYYTTTTLRLEDLSSGKQREVIHFHYTTWPDFGVPQSPTAFLRFLNVVRNSGALDENVGPPVVHCSAGIGRSGTFCLVDSCLILINDMKLENIVVKDILMEMRKYRMGLIQTADQLRFSYLAVIEGVNKAVTLNGIKPDEENDDEEDEELEEDEAPPLPPPRGESLGRSRTNVISNNEDIGNSTSVNSVNNTEHRREESPAARQRKKEREERNQKIDTKVKEMKQKLKEAEHWQKWKKSLLRPWSIGCIILGGGIIVYALFASRG